jgi:hypothetical protein
MRISKYLSKIILTALRRILSDSINLLIVACALSMAKWMRDSILFLFVQVLSVKIVPKNARQQHILPLKLPGNFLISFAVSENQS